MEGANDFEKGLTWSSMLTCDFSRTMVDAEGLIAWWGGLSLTEEVPTGWHCQTETDFGVMGRLETAKAREQPPSLSSDKFDYCFHSQAYAEAAHVTIKNYND